MVGVNTKLFQAEKRKANRIKSLHEASKRSKIEAEKAGIVHNEYSKNKIYKYILVKQIFE